MKRAALAILLCACTQHFQGTGASSSSGSSGTGDCTNIAGRWSVNAVPTGGDCSAFFSGFTGQTATVTSRGGNSYSFVIPAYTGASCSGTLSTSSCVLSVGPCNGSQGSLDATLEVSGNVFTGTATFDSFVGSCTAQLSITGSKL